MGFRRVTQPLKCGARLEGSEVISAVPPKACSRTTTLQACLRTTMLQACSRTTMLQACSRTTTLQACLRTTANSGRARPCFLPPPGHATKPA